MRPIKNQVQTTNRDPEKQQVSGACRVTLKKLLMAPVKCDLSLNEFVRLRPLVPNVRRRRLPHF